MIDLNSENIRNFGDVTPFLPWGRGRYKAAFEGLTFREGFKGKAYIVRLVILESDRNDVRVGDAYIIRLPLSDNRVHQTLNAQKLRAIVAAVFNANPNDAAFDANEHMQHLLQAGADAKSWGIVLDILATDRKTEAGKDVTNYAFRNAAPSDG